MDDIGVERLWVVREDVVIIGDGVCWFDEGVMGRGDVDEVFEKEVMVV